MSIWLFRAGKNGEYEEKGNILKGGESIQYVNFYDLDWSTNFTLPNQVEKIN